MPIGAAAPVRDGSHRVRAGSGDQSKDGRNTVIELNVKPSKKVDAIREQVGHPIVDADGHQMEHFPTVYDFVGEAAGSEIKKRWEDFGNTPTMPTGPEGTADTYAYALNGVMTSFWATPAKNTLDRVTSTLPELLYRRLPEIGLDYSMIYPSFGLRATRHPDAEMRTSMCWALNEYYAEVFGPYRDRLEPVAVIPNFTPEEAIAELNHAVGTLGLKLVLMGGLVPRAERRADGTVVTRLDALGHASAHDYDPVWARCLELGVTPTFHSGAIGWGTRTSPDNYVANHLGSFANGQEGICRSLIIGGAPQRFPDLRFAFLEGGVTWACQLFADLAGHFEKRNKDAVHDFDPKGIDREMVVELFKTFGRGRLVDGNDRYQEAFLPPMMATTPDRIDDFAQSGITEVADFVRIFTEQLYFGCEADDPFTGLGFNRAMLPGRTTLNPIFGSDIGHWDVPDMREVLPEAFELLEHGYVDAEQFRAFTCDNAVRMVTANNPKFFNGTAVEGLVGS
jgi:predicted TIM-barrel fold metal-dependent hydrolase